MKQMERAGVINRVMITTASVILGAVLMCGLMGLLVTKEVIKMDLAKRMVQISAAVGAFIACWLVARSKSRKRLVAAVATSGLLGAICLLGKIVFFGDEPMLWQGVLIILGIGILAGVISSKKKVKRYTKSTR